jgi:hypothetical protein
MADGVCKITDPQNRTIRVNASKRCTIEAEIASGICVPSLSCEASLAEEPLHDHELVIQVSKRKP